MKLPTEFVPDLDHRITVLLTYSVRNDARWFERRLIDGKDYDPYLGDVHSACLEGSSIMARALLEFLGLCSSKPDQNGNVTLKSSTPRRKDLRLGHETLQGISPVDSQLLQQQEPAMANLLARIHNETSKRTAHKNSSVSSGMSPKELRQATKWIVNEVWNRCFAPGPITVQPHLFCQLVDEKWENIPFRSAQ
jgi:hypothetical protein